MSVKPLFILCAAMSLTGCATLDALVAVSDAVSGSSLEGDGYPQPAREARPERRKYRGEETHEELSEAVRVWQYRDVVDRFGEPKECTETGQHKVCRFPGAIAGSSVQTLFLRNTLMGYELRGRWE
ncbi:MAG: hypothetical protein HY554_12905 [Elusimicrobia bacterium]|nr:hypothetical protein [Elusimicrobiota bacterium]